MLLRGATLASGETADVALASGRVAAVGAAAASDAGVHDLRGYVLLPAAAEPHAHLDKALLAERFPNVAGTLEGALAAMETAFPSLTAEDVRTRARKALLTAVRNGYTAVRTHVNLQEGIGTRSLRVLCDLRDELADLVDLQVVAMAGMPFTPNRVHRDLLTEAIEVGADLVGGAPELDPKPAETVALLVQAAADAGLPIDLHLDETTDVRMFTLEVFADEVLRQGLAGRATASHCVSLGQQTPTVAERTAAALRDAGIAVVTLPQTNLWLQGRGARTRTPRGLTATGVLREAGVIVAGGGDNCRDPFNPLGRIDPAETASLLTAAAHLSPTDAYSAVSADARRAMGLPAVAIEVGSPADLLAIRAGGLAEAIAAGDADRFVFRAGRLVARTRVVVDIDPAAAAPQRG